MERRKIIAVTGARSEYDILYPVLKLLDNDPEIELSIIVTGAHLSETYGNTINLIEKDGFHICEKIYNLLNTDKKIGRIISLGNQIPALATTFEREKPDIVLVVGDREEAISVSMTAAYMDIAVAHIAGGDIAKDGNIDNSTRYAASKYSHIHFTILPQHSETLLRLGENEWRIFTVGNPSLDRFIETPHMSLDELSKKIGFDISKDKYLVLIQHPIISETEQAQENIEKTLNAIVNSKLKCLINYPNSDAGNYAIINTINSFSKKYSQLFTFKNLDRITYINVLRHSSCLLGNSSSGIIEAPSIGLPVVNIGSRQRGRVHSDNVIFTNYDTEEVYQAIQKSVFDVEYRKKVATCRNPYGDGKSAPKIVNILKSIKIDSNLIYKNITY